MATVCGHDEGGRGLIDRYLTDLAAELASPRRRRAREPRASARKRATTCSSSPPSTARRRRSHASARRGQLAIESARAAHPVMLLRSTLVFLAALVALRAAALRDPREHAAACTMGRAARPSHLEALRLRRRLRDRNAARADRRRRGLAALRRDDARRPGRSPEPLSPSAQSSAPSVPIQWAQAVPGAGTTLALSLGAQPPSWARWRPRR